MAQQKIYLSKVRDFGENLGDTFQFIKQEFKPLLKSFTLIAGIFIIGTAVLRGIYQMQVMSVFTRVERSPANFSDMASIFSPTYFLMLFLMSIGFVAMQITIAAYMKLYEQTNESPGIEEVWREFRKHFLSALVISVLMWVLIIIGCVFCIAPGVYLGVVFTPAIAIMVNEEHSIGGTFSRCFELVKENFWLSLGIYLVAGLIYYIAAGIIGAIVGIFAGLSAYLTTKQVDSSFSLFTSITGIFGYFFYIVFYISVCLNYYSLAEKLDGFGMSKRLETLGSTNPNERTEEQY
jgi:uncharacterized membrane protein